MRPHAALIAGPGAVVAAGDRPPGARGERVAGDGDGGESECEGVQRHDYRQQEIDRRVRGARGGGEWNGDEIEPERKGVGLERLHHIE